MQNKRIFPFSMTAAKKSSDFVTAFLATQTIRVNQKVVYIDNKHWELHYDSRLEDAFNKGFISVMCIVSCQTYAAINGSSKQRFIAIAKPHFYSSYNTALRHSYNGRIVV